jgi:uncharacterized protein YecT (DUF1311 family)
MRLAFTVCAALALAMPAGVTVASDMGERICCGTDGCDLGAMTDHLARLEASDDELNRTWAAVLMEFQNQPDVIAAIRAAQRTWIALRDQDFEATRLSWTGVADVDDPDVANSVLFAGISEARNLARADFLCVAYLADRG